MANFKQLGVDSKIVKALKELGITEPSPIQEQAIPYLIQNGGDFIGQAQTGTGKTAAFAVPLLHKINTNSKHIQAVILSPTRELGQQIAKQIFKFTKHGERVFTETVYGGQRIEIQLKALARTTHILVATPGRLVELLEKNAVDLSHVKYVVMDEADEMLSMGFKQQLNRILDFTPQNKSTWLFSATFPQDIRTMVERYMREDTFRVKLSQRDVVNNAIEHQFMVVDEYAKYGVMKKFLNHYQKLKGIIFCKTKAASTDLCKKMLNDGFSVEVLNGDLTQKERDKAMRAFKNGKTKILIATDLSARGIDVADLGYVVHYELPSKADFYTHRSGRTARGGKQGISISFVNPKETKQLNYIASQLKIKMTRIK